MMRTGCVAEFASEEALLEAARAMRARDYTRLEAYTPYPVEGLEQVLALKRSWLNWLVFPVAMSGAGLGYLIQCYVNAINYPLNVGGRPPHSWPAFIPITFETSVLLGGVSAFVLFFLLARLPRLWQPIFDLPGFSSASDNGFWLGIDGRDPRFHPERTPILLANLGAARVDRIGPREESP